MGDDYAVRLFHYHVTAARNCYKDEKKTFSVRGNIKKKSQRMSGFVPESIIDIGGNKQLPTRRHV